MNALLRPQHRDESGAALVLALVMISAVAFLLGSIGSLGGTSLIGTSILRSDRAAQYAADGAVDGAIQSIRYPVGGVTLGTPGYAAACYTYSAPPSAPFMYNQAVRVDCTGEPAASGRVVLFNACPVGTVTNCPGQAIVQALVKFVDAGPTGFSQIGYGVDVRSWVVRPISTAAPPVVVVTSLSPNALGQGAQNVPVTVNGRNFQSGATVTFSPSGVTPSSTSGSGNQLTVDLSVSGNAGTGPYSVTVTNPDGQSDICQTCLTIDPAPTASSLPALGQGATNVTVTMTGTGFKNGPGLAAIITGHPGVTVGPVSYVSASQLTMPVTVAATAPAANNYTITLTNGDYGVVTKTNAFTVDAAPKVTSVSPASMGAGSTDAVITVNGSNFVSGAGLALSFSNPGITVQSVIVNSASKISAIISVANGASTGTSDVAVTNGDYGTGSCSGCLTVTSAAVILTPTHIATTGATIVVIVSGFAANKPLQCGINGVQPNNSCSALQPKTDLAGSATFTYTPSTSASSQGLYDSLAVFDGTTTATAVFTVAPVPVQVVLENGSGGTANQIGNGDRVVIDWSDAPDAGTLCGSQWSGTGTQAPITLSIQVVSQSPSDILNSQNGGTGNLCQGGNFNLGTISLGSGSWLSSGTLAFPSSTAVYCSGSGSGLCADPNVSGPAVVILLAGGTATAPATGAVTGGVASYQPSISIKTPSPAFQANANPWFSLSYPATGLF